MNKIKDYITTHNPIVVSINHVPDMYNVDFAFYSNRKRFEEHLNPDITHILTSNIKCGGGNVLTVDYTALCNQRGRFSDNAALMVFSLLQRLGCKSVSVAGLDGYSGSDYYDEDLDNDLDRVWKQNMNATITEAITQYSHNMEIHFITPSIYVKEME